MGEDERDLRTELVALRRRVAELETGASASQEAAARRLSEKEEEWRLFSLATSNMLWRWEFADDSVERNTAFETAFGYSPEEVTPTIEWWVQRLYEDDRERVLSVFQRTLDEFLPSCSYEYRFQRRDGSWACISDQVFIIRDPEGKGLRALGAMTDISDRKRMEEEQARVSNLESLGLLAGGIAHDFNNLLTAVTGNLSLLEWSLVEGSEEKEMTAEALKATQRTQELVARLMTFAKGGEPRKGPGSVDELIRQTTSLCLSGSRTKAAFQIPPDLPAVDMDAVQIGQVIQNLVINAEQSMPDGGHLAVSARTLDLSADNPANLEPGTYVEVAVKDEGKGMAPELAAKVFDPYFSTKETGHGLGLTTANSILTRHGGHIRVDSQPGVGSRFTFCLPVSETASPRAAPVRDVPAAGEGRILLVDDQEVVQLTASRMLRAVGYEIEVAGSAAAGVAAFEASLEAGPAFDLVIMDLTLPGGTGGADALSELLALNPAAKVIVSSGYADDPVMARYEEIGFAGRVEKPYTVAELTQEVRRVLSASP